MSAALVEMQPRADRRRAGIMTLAQRCRRGGRRSPPRRLPRSISAVAPRTQLRPGDGPSRARFLHGGRDAGRQRCRRPFYGGDTPAPDTSLDCVALLLGHGRRWALLVARRGISCSGPELRIRPPPRTEPRRRRVNRSGDDVLVHRGSTDGERPACVPASGPRPHRGGARAIGHRPRLASFVADASFYRGYSLWGRGRHGPARVYLGRERFGNARGEGQRQFVLFRDRLSLLFCSCGCRGFLPTLCRPLPGHSGLRCDHSSPCDRQRNLAGGRAPAPSNRLGPPCLGSVRGCGDGWLAVPVTASCPGGA